MLFNITYGMSFPPSPTQFAVPSVALTPAVMPNGGMSEVSTEPEETEGEAPTEEESTEEEVSDKEAVEGKLMSEVVAGVAEVIVMKVLATSPPPPLENPPPRPPPWRL
jgi:hypothetical protein